MFSLKNPSYPDFVCEADSGVLCVDLCPQHPHMLVLGLQARTETEHLNSIFRNIFTFLASDSLPRTVTWRCTTCRRQPRPPRPPSSTCSARPAAPPSTSCTCNRSQLDIVRPNYLLHPFTESKQTINNNFSHYHRNNHLLPRVEVRRAITLKE